MDLTEDYMLIYPEYSKYWDFWDNFNNLNFIDFQTRMYSLNNTIGDIIRLRSAYLFGGKLTKEERLCAHKSLNSEQLEYLKEKKRYGIIEKKDGLISTMKNFITNEVEKKKNEKSKKGGGKWQP